MGVPKACTLPTAEQPLRVREFHDLFASSLLRVERIAPTRLRLTLAADAEQSARALAAREADCCDCFAFTFIPADAPATHMDIEVPGAQAAVLDGLAALAEAARTR
ncbi:hypothetical protein AB0C34_20920 [Nocardia sp. NPDC049220]|uniref:hypothetical protein n=1 Tax=Nocardia sp. NPDC049220 TaxID=3155273 RepID=UPI0033C39F73